MNGGLSKSKKKLGHWILAETPTPCGFNPSKCFFTFLSLFYSVYYCASLGSSRPHAPLNRPL